MADKAWKQVEREVAEFFGTVRNPLSGAMSGHSGSDTLHPQLFAEVKYRKKLQMWSLWADTKTKARKENKLAILAHKEAGKHGFLITVHCSDLQTLAAIHRGSEILEQPSGNPTTCDGVQQADEGPDQVERPSGGNDTERLHEGSASGAP